MEEKKKIPILNLIIIALLVLLLGTTVFICVILLKGYKENDAVEAVATIED